MAFNGDHSTIFWNKGDGTLGVVSSKTLAETKVIKLPPLLHVRKLEVLKDGSKVILLFFENEFRESSLKIALIDILEERIIFSCNFSIISSSKSI